jgi:hypothetical protein
MYKKYLTEAFINLRNKRAYCEYFGQYMDTHEDFEGDLHHDLNYHVYRQAYDASIQKLRPALEWYMPKEWIPKIVKLWNNTRYRDFPLGNLGSNLCTKKYVILLNPFEDSSSSDICVFGDPVDEDDPFRPTRPHEFRVDVDAFDKHLARRRWKRVSYHFNLVLMHCKARKRCCVRSSDSQRLPQRTKSTEAGSRLSSEISKRRDEKLRKKEDALTVAKETYLRLKQELATKEKIDWNGVRSNGAAVEGCVPGAPECTEWIRFRSKTIAAKTIGIKWGTTEVNKVLWGRIPFTGGGWVFRNAR